MSAPEQRLPFERKLAALRARVEEAETAAEREALEQLLEAEEDTALTGMTAWQQVLMARHAKRPRMLDYTQRVFDDFIELHGDRMLGDDPAMVCGIGRFRGETVFVAGQQKGVSTDEKVRRNFGMVHPWGFRKALRIFRVAERLGYPLVTLVDTPAAHPGPEAEQFGQGPAIAQNLLAAAQLNTPVFAVVLSEGGSGGALAIAIADRTAMFEHAVYMICPPERCAEILWRDAGKREQAAEAMKITAADLLELGIVDTVLPEPRGGAHLDPDAAAATLAEELAAFLAGCREGRWSLARRRKRIRQLGQWFEETLPRGTG